LAVALALVLAWVLLEAVQWQGPVTAAAAVAQWQQHLLSSSAICGDFAKRPDAA
jgi:hypothetical protein